MNCPVCKAPDVTAAHILGHGGKGKAKTLTKAERKARSQRMKALNAARSAKKTNASSSATAEGKKPRHSARARTNCRVA